MHGCESGRTAQPCRSAGEAAAAATPATPADGAAHAIAQMPWRIPLNPDRPTEPLPPEGVAAIHDAAMRVLEETGIDFLNPEARDYSRRRRLHASTASPSAWTAASSWSRCAKAPRQFDMTPRNPARRVTMGGGHMCFVNVSSPPNAMDLDRGRRVGNMEDFKNFMRLTQYFNCIHVAGGYPVEPVDIHASVRHLDCLFEKLTLTDKVVHAYSLGAERVEDVIEMARIASRPRPGRIREPAPPLHQHQLLLARSSTTSPCSTAPCASPAAASRSSSPPSPSPAPWPRSPWPAPSSSRSPRRWPPSRSCRSSAPASPA